MRGRILESLDCCAPCIRWCVMLLVLLPGATLAQTDVPPSTSGPNARPGTSDRSPAGQSIVAVQIVGNRTISAQEIRAELDTRAGQPLDPLILQRDVRSLTKSRNFFDVKVKTQPAAQPNSVVVIFEVFEFPKLEYVYFIGNDQVPTRALKKQVELKVGDPLDVFAIEEAERKLTAFYNEKGYNKVKIDVREGSKRSDHGAVFVVNEGPQQRIWSVNFVGNTIVSGSRLKTQIESKPSKIKYLTPVAGGYVDRRKIDEDVHRLTSYYRSLGYMLARVGRSLEYTSGDRWLNLTFVVDEGPRFVVRNVSFTGNRLFAAERLSPLMNLKAGQYFDLATMNKDVATLTDAYGSVGFILTDIKPSPRTLENAPEIDLVYDISEGNRYRVGRINVAIAGDNPHTQRTVALHRIDLRPGDIVDIRKVRDSERRLRASGLFLNDAARGVRPQIVFRHEDDGGSSGSVRGQSPDNDSIPGGVTIEVVPDPYRTDGAASATGGRYR